MIGLRACLLAALALVTGGAGAQPYQHKPSGFECAEQVAGFARIAVIDYEAQHPGLGAACKYRLQNDIIADVYVYTAGLSPVPHETLHPAMQQLRAGAARDEGERGQQAGAQADHRPRPISFGTRLTSIAMTMPSTVSRKRQNE